MAPAFPLERIRGHGKRSVFAAAATALLLGGCGGRAAAVPAGAGPEVAVFPDCSARVDLGRPVDLPGYRVAGGTCVPFTPVSNVPPAGYLGDYYAAEFTDSKIRARWQACKADPACAAAIRAKAREYMEAEPRITGPLGDLNGGETTGDVDLAAIRRPGFFGPGSAGEPIAMAETATSIVEFTLPPDRYEREALGRTAPLKIRGWYLSGAGVADARGRRQHALVILNNGGSMEVTALDTPAASTEMPGQRFWRGFIFDLWRAGFDVLATDRRGNGLSEGTSAHNTAEQARDIFRELDQLASGDGLRILTPAGDLLSGHAARGHLLRGRSANDIPVILGGYSRGSYATAWAMHMNFVADCAHDGPEPRCERPLGRPNFRGAILYGSNSAGLGYRFVKDADLVEAALREEFHTVYYPDGDVLANIGRWPAVAILRGSWDHVEAVEGSLDAYRRASSPKRLFLFRGPHLLAGQHPDNMKAAGQVMVEFARAALFDSGKGAGRAAPTTIRDLIMNAPPRDPRDSPAR